MKTKMTEQEVKKEVEGMSGGTFPPFDFKHFTKSQLADLAGRFNLPAKFVSLNFRDFAPDILNKEQAKKILDYIKSIPEHLLDGQGLLFSGPVGTGKTALMTTILKYAFAMLTNNQFRLHLEEESLNSSLNRNEGISIYFWSSSDIMLDYFNSKKSFKKKKSARMLAIDDIAKCTQSIYHEILDSILRYRELQCLPTILTCQIPLSDSDFIQTFGTPVTDLIRGNNMELCIRGESKRKSND